MRYPTVLSIAGSDSSGGAGIQADIKAISALGCYAATAITAITVQSTCGVEAVAPVPADIVAAQVRTVVDDLAPDAIKIGMVGDEATIVAVAGALGERPMPPIVLDPVMVATSGAALMAPHALDALRSQLMPLATLLTPNVPEAAALAGFDVTDEASCHGAAMAIARQMCGGWLLIKGGHLGGQCKVDRLYDAQGHLVRTYEAPTVATANTHGTGCTLSSAIAAHIALGHDVPTAIDRAKQYLTAAIMAGRDVTTGHGHGPVNHFHSPLPLQAT